MSTTDKIPDEYLEGLRHLLGDGVPLDKVSLRHGTWMGKLFGKFGQHAVTFGTTIHFTPKAPLDQWSEAQRFGLVAHECYHVKQYSKLGLVPFLVLYLIGRIAIIILRRRIWDHPMEMPAYDIQRLAREQWDAFKPG